MKLYNFCCETFAMNALRHALTQPTELTTGLLDEVCTDKYQFNAFNEIHENLDRSGFEVIFL